jgi:hypothetical protein
MTPKEKAEELFNKYYQYDITIIGVDSKLEERGICLYDAKQLAIIAVEQTILALKQARQWTEYLSSAFADIDNDMNYWINVHKELEKL